jgi:glycosyltransferase involved in cell wall biosynthesis
VKVLLVSQPASDGVFRHVEGLADYLLSQGATVHLAYSDRGACDRLPALLTRIAAAGGCHLNMRVGNAPEPADLPAVLALRQLVKRTQPDILHGHSSKAGALVRALGLIGVHEKVFYTPHAYYRMNAPQGAKARIFHGIERFLNDVGTTLTCSTDERAFARDRIGVPDSRLRMIVNSVDCSRFRPGTVEERRSLRAEFGIPEEAVLLGTVGRFSAQKDPLTTYNALAKVAAAIPNLHFFHLGKGELQPEVDALLAAQGLAGRCHQLPYLADTAPFYRMLDGFLLASIYEGMSYAVIESLASGLPLILTQAPGNLDFGLYGLNRVYWAPPRDATALGEAILAFHRQFRESTSPPNHRDIAVREFSFETCYSRILREYENS